MNVSAEPLESTETIQFADYLRVVRERRFIILLVVVIVVAAAMAVTFTTTPVYQATANLMRQETSVELMLFGTQSTPFVDIQRQLQTGADQITSQAVVTRVKGALHSSKSPGELAAAISAAPVVNANVITVTASSTSPQEAATLANAFATQFIAQRKVDGEKTMQSARAVVQKQLAGMTRGERASDRGLSLQQRLEQLDIVQQLQTGGYDPSQPATVPTAPFSPKPLRNGVLAVIVGLVLGVGLAFLFDFLDRRIKDEERMEREFGVPVLASVPLIDTKRASAEGLPGHAAVGFVGERYPLLESYRTLRSNLQYYGVDRPLQTIVITSALPQEGKTVTAVNLSLALALSGARVILIEGDLRRPSSHKYLGIDDRQGVSNVLAGTHEFNECLQLVRVDDFVPAEARRPAHDGTKSLLLQKNLFCLASGPLPPNPAELVSSDRMRKLIDQARDGADYVIIDSPPVGLVADALSLAGYADAVIVAARMNKTTTDEAREARALLERAGARPIGVVANGVTPSRSYNRYRTYSAVEPSKAPA